MIGFVLNALILPFLEKQIAIIKTSQINTCDYWLNHNTALGRAAGITDEEAEVIFSEEYLDSTILTEREKAAVLWAEQVTRNTAKLHPEIQEKVKKHFSDQELFELTFIISYFNFRNRLHDSLLLPLDGEDILKDNVGFLKFEPRNMKTYLQAVVDNWPDKFPEPKTR